MTVDGMQGKEGKSFNNIDLLQRQPYIFIETTASSKDANPTDFYIQTNRV
jgi:hypothetical protein